MNKELKEICSKCEDYIHCQGKGCAFRSLGNEYCNEVENVNKLINNLQQEIDHQKKIIDRLSRKIQKRNEEIKYLDMLIPGLRYSLTKQTEDTIYLNELINKTIKYIENSTEYDYVILEKTLEILRGDNK